MTDTPPRGTPKNDASGAASNRGAPERFYQLLVESVQDYAIFALDRTGNILTTGNFNGTVQIYNNGVSPANKIVSPFTNTGTSNTAYASASTESVITGLINALQFSASTGSFDNGSIDVYGVS